MSLVTLLSVDTSSISGCFALGHNKFGTMQSVSLEQSPKVCYDTHKCFITTRENVMPVWEEKKMHCDGKGNKAKIKVFVCAPIN